MPPPDTAPQSVVRYLTRLLTAICIHNGGELRIPRYAIRQVEESTARQMLCEDTNTETDELVLRFGTKHSAVYPVEPECLSQKPNQPSVQPNVQPQTFGIPQPQAKSRRPLSEAELEKMERAVRAAKIAARVKTQPASVSGQSELSEILG